MPIDVQTKIEIARPRAEVAAYAADPDKATSWYENIESADWKTPPPLAVGSRIAFVATFLRRRIAYTYEVRAFTPGKRLVMGIADGSFPMETTYAWEDIPGGTRMLLRNRGGPSGLARFFAPLMASQVRRSNRRDLKRLKEILESDPKPAG